MLEDDEFKTRLKLFAAGSGLSEKFRAFNDELIMGKYPSLNTRQRVALRWVLQTLWDIEFNVAIYDEVVIRLKHRENKLFPSKGSIDETITELCESRVLNIETSVFETCNPDGTVTQLTHKVLKLPEKFRIEALNGMAEVFKRTVGGYFSPQKKQS